MKLYGLVCLLLAAMAWGQAASPAPTPATQQPGAAPNGTANPAGSADASKVPPDAPVVLLAPGVPIIEGFSAPAGAPVMLEPVFGLIAGLEGVAGLVFI